MVVGFFLRFSLFFHSGRFDNLFFWILNTSAFEKFSTSKISKEKSTFHCYYCKPLWQLKYIHGVIIKEIPNYKCSSLVKRFVSEFGLESKNFSFVFSLFGKVSFGGLWLKVSNTTKGIFFCSKSCMLRNSLHKLYKLNLSNLLSWAKELIFLPLLSE